MKNRFKSYQFKWPLNPPLKKSDGDNAKSEFKKQQQPFLPTSESLLSSTALPKKKKLPTKLPVKPGIVGSKTSGTGSQKRRARLVTKSSRPLSDFKHKRFKFPEK